MPIDALANSQLMDAQCWLWGQDIRHPEANLLIEYGMCRSQWEDGEHARYYWQDHDDAAVLVWSGGLLLAGADGTIALPRTGSPPRRYPPAESGPRFPDPRRPHDSTRLLTVEHHLVARAHRWIAEYEAWVGRRTAGRWRPLCAERWQATEREATRLAAEVGVTYEPLPPIPARGLSDRWTALGSHPSAP